MAESPSVACASPLVPALAARLKAKKRMMTLVNPADPDDFSTDSMLHIDEDEDAGRRTREVTPVSSATVTQSTMLAVGDSAVKGILRSAGTPGSGNGVRFFPKNRFRVITPRDEVGGPSTPQKQPAPAPPPAPASFFSNLLSVVPIMSPRRPPPVQIIPEAEPDESWERPGEEGEISLVASSVVSAERSTVIGEYDDEEGTEGVSLEVPWTGPAEIHSSPLFIPMEGCSRDISLQDLQPPEVSMDRWKMRMQGQEDVSNLLSISLPDCGETSFSIGSMAGPSFLPPQPARQSPRPTAEDVSGVSWMKGDQSSLLSVPEEDENPTIRRRLSPIPSPLGQTSSSPSTSPTEAPLPLPSKTISPLPIRAPKAYTSIFADMSAEQAELSWPLVRPASASKLSGPALQADETEFHSFLPSSPAPVSTSPTSEPPTRSTLPRTMPTPGNDTEFFDAATSFFAGTPCPVKAPSLNAVSGAALTSLRPSAYTGSLGRNSHLPLGILSNPTKVLFEAHQSHTAAITSELDMYRKLAQTLGREVEERDKALAELNLRLVEGELRASVAQASAVMSKRKSLSPSPAPSPLAAKSQAVAERDVQAVRAEMDGEIRDLEIRLQKALGEGMELREEVERSHQEQVEWQSAKARMEEQMRGMEERERDTQVGQSRQEGQLEARALEAERELASIKIEVQSTREGLVEMRAGRRADEQELQRLSEMVEKAREGRKREDQLRDTLQMAEQDAEELKRERVEMERELEGERRANGDMEVMVREMALHEAQTSLSHSAAEARRDISALEQEASRLRTESSSKDLDLINLQRRKNELKEDREMLNVALDSKQQEVELLKRKLARFSTATPLATSHRHNLDSAPPKTHLQPSHLGIQTPMPSHAFKLHPTTAAPGATEQGNRRRSSATYATPLQVNGRTMRSGAVLMEDQRTSTVMKDRVMRRVPEQGQRENRPPVGEGAGREGRRESRRESVLA